MRVRKLLGWILAFGIIYFIFFLHYTFVAQLNCSTLNELRMLDDMGGRNTSFALETKLGTIISPKSTLLQTGIKPTSVIMVMTLAQDFDRREAIRESWIQWTNNLPIKTFFFMGISEEQPEFEESYEKLKKENEIHQDLIVISFKEGYYRLTIKVLRMLEWFLEYNKDREPGPKSFLVKADHDVFINIPVLWAHLNSPKMREFFHNHTYYLGGLVYKNAKINSDPNSKFYLSKEFWLGGREEYPTYVNGPCYILSENLVESAYKASFFLPLFPFEDIYLTGIIMEKVGVNYMDDISSYSFPDSLSWKSYKISKNVTYFHPVDSKDFMYFYKNLNKAKLL